MDVTSLLNTGATTASAVASAPPPPSTTLEKPAHARGDSCEDGAAASASEGLVPLSSVATLSAQGASSSRRSSISRELPNRNRTPWDADGFSLSLLSPARDNGSSMPVNAAAPTGAPALAMPTCSPSALRPRPSLHRFSDSRSSFSSAYTNASSSASSTTNDSVSHSRLSSLSTVSENPPLASLLADVSLLEGHVSEKAAPASNPHQPWPRRPGDEKTLPAIHNAAPASSTPASVRRDRAPDTSPVRSPRSPSREQSPSDAILIPRAMCQDDEAADLLSENMRLHLHPLHAHTHTHAHGIVSRLPGSPSRRHKRAVSAPDFPSVNESRFPTFGPIPEPTPSPSEYSDGTAMEHDMLPSPPRAGRHRLPPGEETTSPGSGSGAGSSYDSDQPMQSAQASSSPQRVGTSPMMSDAGSYGYQHGPRSVPSEQPGSHEYIQSAARANGSLALADLPVNFEVASACMYRGDCQTGSQLRKAISHIFGRNKLCTRMIPAGVWVHYCRKHYQRTRYRNGGEYPQRQIALVQEQIRRVQAWSDSNMRQGLHPVLKDWSLSVRKREQLRLDIKMAVVGKKRPFRDDNGQEDDQDDALEDDRAEMNGTAVPDWVVEQIGDGYSTTEILSVVDHLKADINEGRLQQIPDIEILPNIVTDHGSNESSARGGTPKKAYTRRRAGSGATVGGGLGGGGHRRSQSVNTAGLHSDGVPMARRRSQSSNNNLSPVPPLRFLPPLLSHANEQDEIPLEKRQRVDSENMRGDGGAGERQHPYGGRVQLAHRPAFAGIRESYTEGTEYRSGCYMYAGEHSSGMQAYGGASDGHYPPPVPTVNAGAPPPLPPLVPAHHEHHYAIHDYEERRDYDELRLDPASGLNGANGYGILPAPYPQRYGRPSVAQLEESSYAMNSNASRRSGAHQRSQSDAGFFHSLTASHQVRPVSPGNRGPLGFSGGPSGYATTETSNVGSRYSQTGPGIPGPSPFVGTNQEQDNRQEPLVSGGFHGRPSHFGSHHDSPYNDEWHSGAINTHSAPALSLPPQPYACSGADMHGSYRYENVQLPPLHSIQGGSFANNAHSLSSRRDYSGSSKHMRHQSSPAVTRMQGLPANVEVSGCSPGHVKMEDK